MIGKTQDTVRNIVEAWMAERGLTRQQVLSILSELMRKHDLVAFGREQAVSPERFRLAAERLEYDGESWETVWFHHAERSDGKDTELQRGNMALSIGASATAEYVVFLRDLVIERETLRDSLINARRALPEFWFPKAVGQLRTKETGVSNDGTVSNTAPATQARQIKREERLEDLREFSRKTYQMAREKQRPWAIDARPVPYAKTDFLEVFRENYPQHDGIEHSTLVADLKQIHTKFAKGKRSGRASTLRDLFKS